MTQVFFDEEVKSCPPVEVEHPSHPWPLPPARFRELFPDGRMESDPTLASAEKGRRILERAVAVLVEKVERLGHLG